jgi:SAM-dependent methyltransferase
MLAYAQAHPRVHYIAAAAEALPFCAGAFHLVTAGMAFHWFDREHFLAEAGRVLNRSGWLALYNNWFGGAVRDNSAFAEWWREHYLVRYPSPPRRGHPLSEAEAGRSGFEFVENVGFENEVSMSPSGLVAYLTTQTNIIAAVEQGRETLPEVTEWLMHSVQPLFQGEPATFPFGGSLWVLRKSPAA